MKYLNQNLLISILVFLLCYLFLDLMDKKTTSYERFTLIETPNIDLLDNENSIKISINNIKQTFIDNTFFGSKYKCDNLLLILDDISYDYLNIKSICNSGDFKSLKNVDNINDLITIESKKDALKSYLINYINYIPENIISIRNEINNIVYLLFNEYFYNCS